MDPFKASPEGLRNFSLTPKTDEDDQSGGWSPVDDGPEQRSGPHGDEPTMPPGQHGDEEQ